MNMCLLSTLLALGLVVLSGCGGDASATASSKSAAAPSASTPSMEQWRRLLRAGAKVEDATRGDLDGDGVEEVVVLSSAVDPDLAESKDVTQEQLRMNLELWVQVFVGRPQGAVEAGRIEMLGGRHVFRVAALSGDAKRKYVVASALHCGASCAGIELHVAGLRDGRFERYLDRDAVDGGDVILTPSGVLEVRETVIGSGDDRAPKDMKFTSYSVRSGALVVSGQRTEPVGRVTK